jgi:hypothetical protein
VCLLYLLATFTNLLRFCSLGRTATAHDRKAKLKSKKKGIPISGPEDHAVRSRVAGTAAAAALIVVSIITGLLLVELTSHLFFTSIVRPNVYDWARRVMFFDGANSVFENHGSIFTYVPSDDVRSLTAYYSDDSYVVEYDYMFHTNNYGLVQDFDTDPNRSSLLILGDSFTEGDGAEPWFRKLSTQTKNNRYQMINGGLIGTGFEQWEEFQDYLSTEKNIHIRKLLVIFISDDYSRGVWNFNAVDLRCLHSIVTCSLDQTIYYRLPPLSGLPDWVSRIRAARNSKSGMRGWLDRITRRFLPASYQVFEYLRAMAKSSSKAEQQKQRSRAAITRLIQKYGPENVIFLHLPQKDEVAGPNELGLEARRAIRESGANLLDGFQLCALSLNDYHIHDGHPNERGYSEIANCVSKVIQKMTDMPQ